MIGEQTNHQPIKVSKYEKKSVTKNGALYSFKASVSKREKFACHSARLNNNKVIASG